jgi:hypothetical protein
MRWAQRLKRVFDIDIETCKHCGGAVKIIACIEDATVTERILTHRERGASGLSAFLAWLRFLLQLLPDLHLAVTAGAVA